ncbi:glycosyltransferase [Salinimicrobium terrae]|uniref:glycosyltransferase n=1 Tax=Salinimicrobium terrae TaxID=470866 RepID=UPI000688F431|nr:glycosyltransferase [Salinimicrobium terrae]
MISIIISSHRENYYQHLLANIKQTIGLANYEIVKIRNPGLMGISKAYNEGAKKAKNDDLLFIHEDVEFLTHGWGNFLIDSLKDKKLGIIGVAGGIRKFNLPTGHDQGIDDDRRLFVKHFISDKDKPDVYKDMEPVKTLDGVFLAMRKDRWKEFKFDEGLKDYHFYDLDISLRVSCKFTNYVTSKIPMHHFSTGNFDNKWIQASLEFHQKSYNYDLATHSEIGIVRSFWYHRLIKEDISLKNRLYYFFGMGVDKYSLAQAINFLFSRIIFKFKGVN